MSGIIKQIRELLDLTDILDDDYTGKNGFILVVNEANNNMELVMSSAGPPPIVYGVALSDEITNLYDFATSGVPAFTDYASFNANISEVMFNVIEPSDGLPLIFDVHINGVSMFSTTPQIDELENTSMTAAIQQDIVNPTIVKGDKIEIFILQVGDTVKGTGAKAKFIGTQF